MKKLSMKRLTLVFAVVFMAWSLLAACSQNPKSAGGSAAQPGAAAQPSSGTQQAAPKGGQNDQASSKLISPKPVTIKGWVPYTPPPVKDVTSYSDHLLWKEIPKRTNITVEWKTVSDKDWQAQLGLIMASGDLPELFARMTPILAEQYGRQGALQPLENLIKKNAPNLEAILNKNPNVRAQITSPDGHIYFFPRLLLDTRTQVYAGNMIRKDWLDKLSLKMPDTIDDLYNVLKAFKEKDPNGNGQPDEAPFTNDPRHIIWAYGVGSRGPANDTDFFIEDQRVKYGPTDPRFKEALKFLNKLYSEGILDREYLGQTGDALNAQILQQRSGFVFGSNAGYLTRFNKLLKSEGKNPGFAAMPPPKGPTGERNILGRHTDIDPTCGGAISVTTKNAETIVKLMDYLYSTEGQILVDFGLEGDTYTMKNGVPTYTDKVANHATLDVLNYTNAYIGHVSVWPTVLMPESYLATLAKEGQDGNALATQYAGKKKIPSLRFTLEEIKDVQLLHRDIDTYVDEHVHGFIRGTKSLNDYDAFLSGLKSIGVEKLVGYYDKAYQRFLSVTKQ